MNTISKIRTRLGVTQATLAKALGVSQGNVSNYEHGQAMPAATAKKLIEFSITLGEIVTYNDIYGDAPPAQPSGESDLPNRTAARASRRATDPAPPPGHAGRQPPSPTNILDTVPRHCVVLPSNPPSIEEKEKP